MPSENATSAPAPQQSADSTCGPPDHSVQHSTEVNTQAPSEPAPQLELAAVPHFPASDSPAHIDLALSGGGFRATLFHLGVLGFLSEYGLLHSVRTICSVSGGSIIAAHLVTQWEDYKADFPTAAARLLKAIAKRDVSKRVMMRSIWRALSLRTLNTEQLVEEYRHILRPPSGPNSNFRWQDLPYEPALHVLATSMKTGAICVFNRAGMQLFDSQHASKHSGASTEQIDDLNRYVKANDMRGEDVARAVAASSAFPPVFDPLQPRPNEKSADRLLTDGGVYDNSGVNYLLHLYEINKWNSQSNRMPIICDAGRAFSADVEAPYSLFTLAMRVTDAQANRIAEFDADRADSFFTKMRIHALRCSIHDKVELRPEKSTHSLELQDLAAAIRTELDVFSAAEIFVLYRHGYIIAQKQYAKYCNERGKSWEPREPK